MSEFFNVLSLGEARKLIIDNWPDHPPEEIGLEAALGRRLAIDITAGEDSPSFPRSTVDGYAAAAQDVFGASESIPAFLALKGEVVMGCAPDFTIGPGECAWIPTGGMVPEGASVVVMVEYTEKLGDDTILVTRPAGFGENIIRIGEDCQAGSTAIPAGRVIRPQDIGVAAALGITRLTVEPVIRAGIISTGDEIVDIQCLPQAGQVRDVNSYILAAAVRKMGGKADVFGVVPDDFDRLKQMVARVLEEKDCVILSGGSSVGTRDMSLQVLLSFPDSKLLFHGLSIKPGKPTLAVKIGDKLAIGLPGHPVSALMVFKVLVGQVFDAGYSYSVRAILSDNIASQSGRDDFVRVGLTDKEGETWAMPIYGKTGLIRVMSEAQGYIHIPYEKQGLSRGEKVIVYIF